MPYDVEAIGAIMENVDRLIDDSTYLIKGDRLASAFVVNVIALEEVGKVIHMMWRGMGRPVTSQKRTAHLQKQWAFACVMVADKMLPDMRSFVTGRKERTDAAMIELAVRFIDSPERRFFEGVVAKNIERAKHLGLYSDESDRAAGRHRDALDNSAVQYLSDALLWVVPLLKSEVVVHLAAVFYEVLGAHQEAILEQGRPDDVAGRN